MVVRIIRHIRGIYTFRGLFYMPVVSSFVSVSLIWLWMYEPQFGLFNYGLEVLGLPRLKWMRSAQTAILKSFSAWQLCIALNPLRRVIPQKNLQR